MNQLQDGISAAREGRQAEARTLLQQALQADPRTEQGWLWMSAVVETDAERRTCLERVLTINPNNLTAQAGLEKLGAPHDPEGDGQANLTGSPSAHSLPTQSMSSVKSSRRPIERLAPQPAPTDGIAQLRAAAQFQPPDPSPNGSSPESDPFMALVLIGGLSITAIAGALMLGILWLFGWPP
jgi:hypothetical protein